MADAPVKFYSRRYPFQELSVDGFTVLMLHFDGSDGDTTTTDSSPLTQTVTMSSPVVLDDSEKFAGTTSAYWPESTQGSNDDTHQVFVDTLTGGDILPNDFTLEIIVKFEAITADWGQSHLFLWVFGTSSAALVYSWIGKKYNFQWNPTGGAGQTRVYQHTGNFTIETGVWYYFAAIRQGNNLRLYVFNIDTANVEIDFSAFVNEPISGSFNNGGTLIMRDTGGSPTTRFQGWVDEARISTTVRSTDKPVNFYSRASGDPINFYSRNI